MKTPARGGEHYTRWCGRTIPRHTQRWHERLHDGNMVEHLCEVKLAHCLVTVTVVGGDKATLKFTMEVGSPDGGAGAWY